MGIQDIDAERKSHALHLYLRHQKIHKDFENLAIFVGALFLFKSTSRLPDFGKAKMIPITDFITKVKNVAEEEIEENGDGALTLKVNNLALAIPLSLTMYFRQAFHLFDQLKLPKSHDLIEVSLAALIKIQMIPEFERPESPMMPNFVTKKDSYEE